MKKIWFRVGMEAEITDEELDVLMNTSFAAGVLMQKIIDRAELSGETYILGTNNCGKIDGYDNPEEEISFLF